MKSVKNKWLFFRSLKMCWSRQKKYIILITGVLVIKTILPFITLLALQEFLNLAQNSDTKHLNNTTILIISIYFISIITSSFFNNIYDYLHGIFKMKLNYDINCMIIEKATKLSLADYENSDTYDKLQRALQETQTPYLCINSIYSVANNIMTLIGNICILMMWKWYIVIILSAIPALSAIFTVLIGKYEYQIMRSRVTSARKITYFRMLISDVVSCKENKVLNTENKLFHNFKIIFSNFIKKDKEILSYKTISILFFGFLENAVGIVVIFQIILSLIKKTILIGTANTYINCVWNSIKSVDTLIDNIAKIYTKIQYVYNIFEFLDEDNSHKALSESTEKDIENIESIEFVNVSFRYRFDLPYALKNINCIINRHDKLVIVGDSGSGKTTFIKLLCGLYDDYEGEILINGISLKKINKHSYHEKLGIVFQDFVKYEFTLKESLLFGKKDNNETHLDVEKRVEELTNQGIIKFAKNLSAGIDTQLGSKFDKGVQLSGGEWQQVAFARALLRNSDVYIFDEPSSGLDVISEESMYKILKNNLKNTICLLVTHRLYIVNNYAERALVFQNGRIIEDDKVQNLLKYNSYYKYMYDKTQG